MTVRHGTPHRRFYPSLERSGDALGVHLEHSRTPLLQRGD
jgi:hypothetical protein